MSGLLLLLSGLLVYVYFADDRPYDDRHLIPTFPLEAAGGEDALTVFCRAMPKLSIDAWRDFPANFMELRKEDHEAMVEELLGKSEKELILFEELMRSDLSAWRWPDVDEEISPSEPMAYLTKSVVVASRVNSVQVMQLRWKRRYVEAAEQALKGARFGNALTKVDGLSIHLLMALTSQVIGERILRGAVVDADDSALLQLAQRRLEEYDVEAQSVARSLKVEWLYAKNRIGALDAATYDAMGLKSWQRLASSHLYLENRSAAVSGRHVTTLISGLEINWIQGNKAFQAVEKELDQIAVGDPMILLRPNAGGKILTNFGLTSLISIGRRACGTSALHRMAIINLALRRFELDHDRIPDRLDELVPAYLLSVPVDPFDGKPLRWDAPKRWVYSVGNNGTDDHGRHHKPERTSDEDIVMPYWWLPEPEPQPASSLATPMRRRAPTKSP